MSSISEPIFNVVLRGATLLSKSLLLFFLVKYLSQEQVGEYGLIAAAVGYGIYFIGLDFYTYTSREVLVLEKNDWSRYIINQIKFVATISFLSIPLLYVFILFSSLNPLVLIWFSSILVFEYLSLEIYRFLVLLQKTTKANIVLFIRSGIWVLLLMVFFLLYPGSQQLDFVWWLWIAGAILSVFLGSFWIVKELGSLRFDLPIDWKWCLRGVKIALPFFLGTIMLRAVFTLDKFILEYESGLRLVGVYTFYIGIVSALLSFIEAGVISRKFPALIQNFKSGCFERSRKIIVEMCKGVCLFLGVFYGAVLYFLDSLLMLLDLTNYLQDVNTLWILLLMIGFYSLSYIPHYVLYAAGRDIPILIVTSISFGLAMLLYIILIPRYGMVGASISLCLSMFFLAVSKGVLAYRVFPSLQGQDG